MEYGLWNLHGGLWTGNNPCAGSDRSLYNSVNASGGSSFHGCPETMPFSNMASSVPCRSTYRGQPEFVAMKPGGMSTRPSTETVPVLPPRAPSVSENVEVMPSLQNEILTEHNGQESGNSHNLPMNIAQSTNNLPPISMPESSSNHANKKVKMSRSSRKRNENVKNTVPLPSMPVPYLNQQYNSVYSMMFGRTATKRPDTTSDESEDDDEENANEADNYSNTSSAAGNQSPTRTGMSRTGYECAQCDLVADTRPALKKHISLCHPGPQPDSDLSQSLLNKPPGACPMPSCHFRSMSPEELEAHIARHVADGYQRHSSSSKKRSSAISLQRIRYEREEYRCQMCSYSCTIEKAFYKHLKLHSMGMNVPAVKISCVICGKDRPSEVEMNKHMRKHRDNRYFCCDICIFRTVQLKKLIQHRRMHTGEKPHLCPHCAYRSARRDNLRSHVRRVHKKDNLFCDTFSPRGLLLAPSSPSRLQ